MSMIRVVGIIAKSVFQVCVWMVDGSVAWNKKISRSKLLDTIRQFEPGTLVAMEACATSHFWGRTLSSMGYCVRLIPAQHVKAFVRSQKNDANDALAICETALRPGIHCIEKDILKWFSESILKCKGLHTHPLIKLAPLTGIAFASNWLKNKLNLNSLSVKTTRVTTTGYELHKLV